ncbi:MAG: putative translation initiation factor subunit [Bacteroidetes bacterium]|nr:putative translation initiation factor subunit [Bacteroidota bacterium]
MKTIEWIDGLVRFLDQTRLPLEEQYVETADVGRLADAIKRLEIRGAPAIGVAAAFGVVLASRDATSPDQIRTLSSRAIQTLASTRPTAVNLFTALDRMSRVLEAGKADGSGEGLRARLLEEAQAIQKEDIDACRRIGELGSALILPGSSVLTHCNAGALATAGEGTALSVIFAASRKTRIERVYVDETRPLLQGARLTTWELLKNNIEAVLITDSTAGVVLQQQRVQAVIVGADRIAANGDTANKIGTYSLAVLAERHHVPFYVAAPVSTIDFTIASGAEITIEERAAEEVTWIAGTRVAPEGVSVFAPAFDVTPNELIAAIVTDRGILAPPFSRTIASLRSQPRV